MNTTFVPDPKLQRVVCAAIKSLKGLVICSARHFDNNMRAQIKALAEARGEEWSPRCETLIEFIEYNAAQGFIDNFGQFLTRQEAYVIAKDKNQIVKSVTCPGELYSENLY